MFARSCDRDSRWLNMAPNPIPAKSSIVAQAAFEVPLLNIVVNALATTAATPPAIRGGLMRPVRETTTPATCARRKGQKTALKKHDSLIWLTITDTTMPDTNDKVAKIGRAHV